MQPLAGFRKTRADLVTDTQFLLRDPNGERYSTARIAEELNDAALDFALRTQMTKDEINVRLLDDVFEYDIKLAARENGAKKEYAWPLRIGYDGDDQAALSPDSLFRIDLSGWRRNWSQVPSVFYLCAVSPGKIQILGQPTQNGDALPSENNNIQVTYIAFPTYMSAAGSYPDSRIPSYFHQALPYGAAASILEEGNGEDLALADYYEAQFQRWVAEAITEATRGETQYNEFRPL